MPRHRSGPICPSCSNKLEKAHHELLFWFTWCKGMNANAHISWAYRGEKEQNEAFEKGLSKAQYPKSPHNHTDENGNPEAYALDIFELTEENTARFEKSWYEKIWLETMEAGWDDIEWGGNFKTQKGDLNHFQLKEKV